VLASKRRRFGDAGREWAGREDGIAVCELRMAAGDPERVNPISGRRHLIKSKSKVSIVCR
jgi:hypothetical protein